MAYLIDPDRLHAIVQGAVGRPIEDVLPRVIDGLVEAYGEHIYVNDEWMFSNAGGIMGTMLILHASFNEYMVIWGTPHGTEGHSGRHRAELWDFVLAGELSTYKERDRYARKWAPGEVSYLGRGEANSSKMPDGGCWLLEYGRGAVGTMLPFAVLDVLSSTMDWRGLVATFRVYTRCVLNELRVRRRARR